VRGQEITSLAKARPLNMLIKRIPNNQLLLLQTTHHVTHVVEGVLKIVYGNSRRKLEKFNVTLGKANLFHVIYKP